MREPRPLFITALIFLVMISCCTSPASAQVQDKNFSSATSTIRAAPVALGLGNEGSSSLSPTSDYGSVTTTAGLTFYETASATVSATTAPSLDGSVIRLVSSSPSGTTPNLNTATANDIIYVIVAIRGTTSVSSVTNSGSPTLTWTLRAAVTYGSNERVETWYAISTAIFTGKTITVNFGVSTTAVIIAFGIKNANIAHPFDASPTALQTNTGTGTTQSVTISTINPNDFIIGAIAAVVTSGVNPAAGTGYKSIQTSHQGTLGGAGEYKTVTTTQSSTAVTFTTTSTVTYAIIGDAVQGYLPSVASDTSLTAPGSSSSFTVAASSSAFLWSPVYSADTTIYAGSWVLNIWARKTTSGTLTAQLVAVDSSNSIMAQAASGSTNTITTTKTEVTTTYSGSQITVPSGGRLLVIIRNPSGTLTVYWGTGQLTNYKTPSAYDYVLSITSSASASYSVSLSVYSSSNIGRLKSLTVSIYNPSTTEITIANGAFTLSSGPTVTLPAGSTLYVAVSATANALGGSSTVVLYLKIAPSAHPFSYDIVSLTVN